MSKNLSPTTSRRDFTRSAIHSILTLSLVDSLCRNDLFAGDVKPITTQWLRDVNQIGWDVKKHKLKQLEWQKRTEELFKKVDMAELLRFIDFDAIMARAHKASEITHSLRFDFPRVDGVPSKLAFGKQIFVLDKDRSVVPHGHDNMATAFLILKGDFRGRHYDRVKDERRHILIKPTIDRKFKAGDCSTVSDVKDNVHWFKALKGPAFIFNIHVLGVTPKKKRTGRVYLDPMGEKLKSGLVRARRVSFKVVNELYG